jgi:PPOX class probable F420-dependent enzyme
VDAEELRAFLDRSLNGVVSTLRAGGSPHSVPVWYRYDGSLFHIWTGEERAWVRNVSLDPRVTLTVHDSTDPLSAAVIISGRGTIRTGTWADTEVEARLISERYVDTDELDDYIESWRSLTTIVTIEPTSVLSWP